MGISLKEFLERVHVLRGMVAALEELQAHLAAATPGSDGAFLMDDGEVPAEALAMVAELLEDERRRLLAQVDKAESAAEVSGVAAVLLDP